VRDLPGGAQYRSAPTMAAVTLVTLGLLAAACGGDNKATTTTSASPGQPSTSAGAATTVAQKPTPGGKLVVRVEAEVGNPWTPANMQCDSSCQTRARTFFEPLIAVDATDGKPHPYLAQSVSHSSDYKIWTVKLRSGIKFTDGTPLNADALVDNTNRVRKSLLLGAAVKDIVEVRKVDDLTAQVRMSRPWVSFDYFMGTQGSFAASPTWLAKVDKDPTQASKPVGTGPFVLTDFKPRDVTIVKRNPNYWRKSEGLPYLDEIDFRVIEDELTAANAFKAGQLDVLVTDNGQNIKAFKDNQSYTFVAQKKQGETNYVMFNVGQDGSPLQDQRVRCGLAAAVDPSAIDEAIHANQLQVANGPFSPGQEGYLQESGNHKPDPGKAKALIADWSKDHGGQKPKILYTTTNDAANLQIAQLYDEWWKAAGVDVSVAQVTQDKLIINALVGDPSFNAFGWRNHAGIVLDQQYYWWHSSQALPENQGKPALNFGRLKDPVIDRLLDDAHSNPDPAARKADAEQVNRQFAKQCWIIPTVWTEWGIVLKPKVQGEGTTTFPAGAPGIVQDGAGFPGQLWWQQVWLKQ
jgi:peptide/nickel transport system substrate-binding protein